MSRVESERVRLLIGTTGTGKTYKMRELLNRENRCFLFDLMADPKFEDWGVLVDNMEDAVKLAKKTERYRVRMQFDEVERFDFLCKLHVKQPHGLQVFENSTIAVDELAMFCSSAWLPDGLKNVIRLGRHTQSRFIATTQRPPDITPFIRSQAKEQYLFQMHEPIDLQCFAKRLPDVNQLTTLKTGEYILWKPSEMNANFSLRRSRNSLGPSSMEPSVEYSNGNKSEE